MCHKLIVPVSIVFLLCFTNALNAELVAHWQFEGDFLDATGNGHDGTPFDAPTIVDDRVRGQVLESDGAGRVRVGDAADLNYGQNESFSYMLWVNYDPGLVSSGWRTIFVKGRTQDGGGTAYNADMLYGFWVSPDGNWHVSCGGVRADTEPAEAGEWHHLAAAQDGDAGTVTFYIDGQENPAGGGAAGPCESPNWPLYIGAAGTDQAPFEAFGGRVDEAQIYSHALGPQDVQEVIEFGVDQPQLKALQPEPADGAAGVAFPLLTWMRGDRTAWEMLYFGMSPGLTEADLIAPRLVSPVYLYGPAILEPGVTYYWRVDSVEIDGVTIHEGDVWSFTVVPATAWAPQPADGAQYVDPQITLEWSAGMYAVGHTTYFAADAALVEAGDPGAIVTPASLTSVEVGPLERGTTYYWRVDETIDDGTVAGDVWSFTVRPVIARSDPNLVGWWKLDDEGTGKAVDYSGSDLDGTLFGDPQWVEGYLGEALEFDGAGDYVDFGNPQGWPSGTAPRSLCGWGRTDRVNTGWRWIAAYGSPATSQAMFIGMNGTALYGGGHGDDVNRQGFWEVGVWHHIALTYDGTTARLYADGVEVASASKNWDLVLSRARLGRQVSGAAEFWDGLVDDVRLYDKTLTPDEIAEIMRGDTALAWNPQPKRGAELDIRSAVSLGWSAGDGAAQHDVYFGTDRAAVKAADANAAEYLGRHTTTSHALAGLVEFAGGTYYWRIDEVAADETVSRGLVWAFTIPDYLIVDDFESYTNDSPHRLFQTWIDGLGFSADEFFPAGNPGSGTGALVGHDIWSVDSPHYQGTIVETGNVHGGTQAMPLYYDNSVAPFYGEAERTWATPQDWTVGGVNTLSLWVRGEAGNVADTLYIVVEDSTEAAAVIVNSDTSLLTNTSWTEWPVPLSDITDAGVDVTTVRKMSIGVGNRNAPAPTDAGVIYVDDIFIILPK